MLAERDMVRRCLAGEHSAMQELLSQFQAEVFGLCVKILRHRHDAEDVTQEVFLRIFRGLASWDDTRPLRPWIATITVNRCRTWISKREKIPSPTEFLADVPSREPNTEDGNELNEGIREVVSQMRDDYREVFILFHEAGRTYEEIAEIVQRPVGTIKTWLHRARTQVLDKLQQRGLVAPDSIGANANTQND